MRSAHLLPTLVCGAVLLAACTSPGTTALGPASVTVGSASVQTTESVTRAQQLCETALGAQNVVSSGPVTTVGELRAMKQGPGFQPAKGAFPELPDSAAASYCWTGSRGKYDSFGVTDDGQQVWLGGMEGVSTIPSGPPVIP